MHFYRQAHNGIKFDFAMIASSCWRSDNSLLHFLENWLFVDTLDLLKAAELPGVCLKLQCQRVARGVRVDACAHRALDDCVALAAVVAGLAESLGQTPRDLLMNFAVKFDLSATAAELSALL